jgi:hypothetical protein
MDISQDLKSHWKRYIKYVTPNCIIFYDLHEYNTYMKKYNEVNEIESSKK